MNTPTISSASVLPKLKITITEDIETLSNMLKNRDPKSVSYELINSMLDFKKSVLELIPPYEEKTGQSPTTSQKLTLVSYKRKNLEDFKDEEFLNKTMFTIEKDQQEYLTYALQGGGLPEGIEDILNSILGKYMRVVTQLERNKNTSQINPIQS